MTTPDDDWDDDDSWLDEEDLTDLRTALSEGGTVTYEEFRKQLPDLPPAGETGWEN